MCSESVSVFCIHVFQRAVSYLNVLRSVALFLASGSNCLSCAPNRGSPQFGPLVSAPFCAGFLFLYVRSANIRKQDAMGFFCAEEEPVFACCPGGVPSKEVICPMVRTAVFPMYASPLPFFAGEPGEACSPSSGLAFRTMVIGVSGQCLPCSRSHEGKLFLCSLYWFLSVFELICCFPKMCKEVHHAGFFKEVFQEMRDM